MGWSMNDLRSRNRTLAPVPSLGPRTGEIVSTPPKARPKGNPLFQDSRPADEQDEAIADDELEDEAESTQPTLSFPVSRDLRSMPVTAATGELDESEVPDHLNLAGGAEEPEAEDGGPSARGAKGKKNKAPASRPAKRRETLDSDESEDDKFPWHYQFDDDEPEELQAKSPLLSRAFRSSVG